MDRNEYSALDGFPLFNAGWLSHEVLKKLEELLSVSGNAKFPFQPKGNFVDSLKGKKERFHGIKVPHTQS
jgi:hypothetical protein